MNLFDGRLGAQASLTSRGLNVTGNRMDSNPYTHALEQARNRLAAARLAYDMAGEHVDACSDEVLRIERMAGQYRAQVERVLGDPAEAAGRG